MNIPLSVKKIRQPFTLWHQKIMSSISIPVEKLRNSNDKRIPLLGFGSAEFPFGSSPPEAVKDSILHAIQLGYRHFDTASVYKNEEPLGEAIAEALRLGIVNSRDELFITSKLWCCDAHPHLVLPALRKSLRNLKLEYLDLYLIHFPLSIKPGHYDVPMNKDFFMPMDINSTWEAMEECQNLGLTKSIGVSNFTCNKLQTLLATSKIPPAVNQVEINPLWHQKKLREFCEEKGIHVSGYSPLGGRGTMWSNNNVLDSEILNQIADAHRKTVGQVCLRWAYQQGISVIMKSFNKERMKENLGIFDWELSNEDLQKISEIPQSRGYLAREFVADQGPYKTIEEFWDGEL